MSVKDTTACANKARRSTSAVYHVAKATARHGECAVILKMAELGQSADNLTWPQALIRAAMQHDAILTLSEKGAYYKVLGKALDGEAAETLKLPLVGV
jgi:hypothetical protein